MTASMVFGGPTRLTLMTGTCSLASHPKASATASTAPPVGRPQNTSAAYRAEPGAAPWKALARPTMSEATAVPCSAGTAMPQPCCWIVMPLNTSCVTSTPLSMRPMRSEEHTSELQSHSDLVCRLLLEKKKKKKQSLKIMKQQRYNTDIIGAQP